MKEIGPTRFSTRLTVTPDGLRFRQPGQAVVLGLFVSFIFALCLSGCVDAFARPQGSYQLTSKIAYPLLIAIAGCLMFRTVRSGTLIASPRGIVIRNLLRTHRLHWHEMACFEEQVAPIGASGVPRRFLRVHFAAGGFRNFTELNDSQRRNPDVVAELVRRLGEMKKVAATQPHRRRISSQPGVGA